MGLTCSARAPSPRVHAHGLQLKGALEVGLRHRGPRSVVASGTLSIASGPAMCSPLKGVVPVKPHAAASAGLLNQKPTWKVLVGARVASGSKPKIWFSRMV